DDIRPQNLTANHAEVVRRPCDNREFPPRILADGTRKWYDPGSRREWYATRGRLPANNDQRELIEQRSHASHLEGEPTGRYPTPGLVLPAFLEADDADVHSENRSFRSRISIVTRV